jgi:pentatricopeptide repeat protein
VDVERFRKEIPLSQNKIPLSLPFPPREKGEKYDYYIIISALTEFKRVDVSIQAFNKMSDKNLVIV